MRDKRLEYQFVKGKMIILDTTGKALRLARRLLRTVLVSVSLSAVAFLLLCAVVDTDADRILRRENRMYEKMYSDMSGREKLVSDVVEGLRMKDGHIYDDLFHAAAPDVDPVSSLEMLFGADTIPDSGAVSYSKMKADALTAVAADVDAAFDRIFRTLCSGSCVPPMTMPVENISYPQIGASRGRKLNPFYNAYVQHGGLDIIAPLGADVLCPADGVVTEVVNSRKGKGRQVTVEHAGGYSTYYAHLSSVAVTRGRTLKKGDRIGQVGMTGNAFAPHLHYEVHKDGVQKDPMGFVFASVSPEEYANMLFMAVNTKQSMD